MPGTNPEITIPAITPEQTATLSPNTPPLGATSTINPVVMSSSRRESIVNPTSGQSNSYSDCKPSDDDPVTVALKQFVSDDRHFSLLRNFRLADLITIFNGVCGSLSIFSSAYFLITLDLIYLKRACMLPMFSLGFDFLDGKVARFRGESSVLGQELDSLADLISFGVAPALVGFTIGLRHPTDILILTFFICAGLTRLARFNSTAAFHQRHPPIQSPDRKRLNSSNSFEGIPIPTSLWLVAGMYESIRRAQVELPSLYYLLLSDSNQTQSNLNWLKSVQVNGNQLIGGLVKNSFGIQVHWLSFAFASWGFMMLSKTLRVPKL